MIAYNNTRSKYRNRGGADMDFDNLTEEQKAKALACTSPEELLSLAREEGYELTDEQLDGIAGGWSGSDCISRTERTTC